MDDELLKFSEITEPAISNKNTTDKVHFCCDDIVRGDKFGLLEVIDSDTQIYDFITRRGTPNKSYLRKCLCVCGTVTYVHPYNLINGTQKSCGCWISTLRRKQATDISAFNSVISQYKLAARNRSLEWNLTNESAIEIMKMSCFYCGAAPSNKRTMVYVEIAYNGIDRLNNKVGYDELNCVPCCKMCNYMKGTNNLSDFLEKIAVIYDNLNLNYI